MKRTSQSKVSKGREKSSKSISRRAAGRMGAKILSVLLAVLVVMSYSGSFANAAGLGIGSDAGGDTAYASDKMSQTLQLEDGTQIDLSWDDNAGLADDTTGTAELIAKGSDNFKVYKKQALAYLTKEYSKAAGEDVSLKVTDARFAEIHLEDTEGNEVQPEAAVTAKIKFADPVNADSGAINVIHFTGNTNAAKDNTGSDKTTPELVDAKYKAKGGEVSSVTFNAESFSVYGIVTTTTQAPENTGDADADKENGDTQSGEQLDAGASSTEEKKDEAATEKEDKESVADDGSTEQSSESVTDESSESETNASTDESGASDGTADSEDVTYISGTQTASVGNAAVKVTYDETAQIPEGAELVAEQVSDTTVYEAMAEGLLADYEINDATYLDIHFEKTVTETGEDGEETEKTEEIPANSLTNVTITLEDQDALGEDEEIKVVHFKEDGGDLGAELVESEIKESTGVIGTLSNGLKKIQSVFTQKEADTRTNQEVTFEAPGFSVYGLINLGPSIKSISGAQVAADGTYTSRFTVDKYKYGVYDKSYYGTLYVYVEDGKISGLYYSGDKSSKINPVLASSGYIGVAASVSAIQNTSVDAVSGASLNTSSSGTVDSTSKKSYVMDLQSAIISAIKSADPASGNSSQAAATVADGVYKGSSSNTSSSVPSSESDNKITVYVTVSDGKITDVSVVSDETKYSWDDLVETVEGEVSGINAASSNVDAVSSATSQGWKQAIYDAVKNALSSGTSVTPSTETTTGTSHTLNYSESICVNKGDTVTLQWIYNNNDYSSYIESPSSSDTSVVTVSGSGSSTVATAVGTGYAKVTATAYSNTLNYYIYVVDSTESNDVTYAYSLGDTSGSYSSTENNSTGRRVYTVSNVKFDGDVYITSNTTVKFENCYFNGSIYASDSSAIADLSSGNNIFLDGSSGRLLSLGTNIFSDAETGETLSSSGNIVGDSSVKAVAFPSTASSKSLSSKNISTPSWATATAQTQTYDDTEYQGWIISGTTPSEAGMQLFSTTLTYGSHTLSVPMYLNVGSATTTNSKLNTNTVDISDLESSESTSGVSRITVKKTWAGGSAPSDVTSVTATVAATGDSHTVTLNSGNSWTAEVDDLDTSKEYTVTETAVNTSDDSNTVEDYTVSYSKTTDTETSTSSGPTNMGYGHLTAGTYVFLYSSGSSYYVLSAVYSSSYGSYRLQGRQVSVDSSGNITTTLTDYDKWNLTSAGTADHWYVENAGVTGNSRYLVNSSYSSTPFYLGTSASSIDIGGDNDGSIYGSTNLLMSGTSVSSSSGFTPFTAYDYSSAGSSTTVNTATYTITNTANASSSQQATITPSRTSVSVDKDNTATVDLTLVGCTVSDSQVTVADSDIATVSKSGNTLTITGVKDGTTTITISGTATGSYTAPESKTITVKVGSGSSSGNTKKLTGTGTDSDPYTLSLSMKGVSGTTTSTTSSTTTTTTYKPVDVVLVLDYSYSIVGNGALSNVKQSAIDFVNDLAGYNTNSKVAVVTYGQAGYSSGHTGLDHHVTTTQGWTSLSSASTVTSAISSSSAGSSYYDDYDYGTNHAGAYSAAKSLIDSAGDSNDKYVINISDGVFEYTTSPFYDTQYSAAMKSAGATIYYLYWPVNSGGSQSDTSKMASLAGKTGQTSSSYVLNAGTGASNIGAQIAAVEETIKTDTKEETTTTTTNMTGLTIQDTLSSYVDFAKGAGDHYGVAVKAGDTTLTYGTDYTVSVSDRVIRVTFSNSYSFDDATTYTASFPVKTNAAAQAYANEQEAGSTAVPTNADSGVYYTYTLDGTETTVNYTDKPSINIEKIKSEAAATYYITGSVTYGTMTLGDHTISGGSTATSYTAIVDEGGNLTVSYAPMNSGYAVKSVTVDDTALDLTSGTNATSYTFSDVSDDHTIDVVYAAASSSGGDIDSHGTSTTVDGDLLELNKSAGGSYNDYTLSLDAYAKANAIKQASQNENADIVLALDVSKSMDGSSITALNTAVQNFVSQMPSGKSVGIVTFANSATNLGTYTSSNASSISFSADSSSTGTNMTAGLNAAQSYLSGLGGSNSKYIILFSDGYPEYVSPESSDEQAQANAINAATTIKNAGTKIFAINVSSSADSSATVATKFGTWGSIGGYSSDIINNVMQYISSNYTGASATYESNSYVTVSGASRSSDSASYYVTSSNSDWSSLFSTVQDDIYDYETVNLNASSVLKDFASSSFDFSEATVTAKVVGYDSTNKIWNTTAAYSVSQTGAGTATASSGNTSFSLTVSNSGFSVTGFDYSTHWLADDGTQGSGGAQKIVIEVTGYKYNGTLTSESQTLDTNNTSSSISGIYASSSATDPAAEFGVPTVTVPSQSATVTPSTTDDYGSKLTYGDSWQMVSNRYDGNSSSDKTKDSSGNVALQKNVVPVWDNSGNLVENEFLVYLGVDRIIDAQSYFDISANTTLHHENDHQKGDVLTSAPTSSTVDAGTKYSATFIVKDTGISSDAFVTFTYSWKSGSNCTAYTKLPNGNYLCWGGDISSGSTVTIDLNDSAISDANKIAFYEGLFKLNTLLRVEDQLGSQFTYEGVYNNYIDGSLDSDSVAEGSTGTIKWTIGNSSNDNTKTGVAYSKLTSDSDKLSYLRGLVAKMDSDGKITLTNDAEMVYNVKFTPTTSSLEASSRLTSISDTTAADNDDVQGETDVNDHAYLYYKYTSSSTETQAVFNVPEVRGMLYDINLTKTGENSTLLSGATFSITKTSGWNQSSFTTQTVTSDSNGIAAFNDLTYGTYTVTETAAPNGYKLGATTSWTFTIPENAPIDGSFTLKYDPASGDKGNDLVTAESGGWTNIGTNVENEKTETPLTGVITGKESTMILILLGIMLAAAAASYYLRRRGIWY